MDRILRPLGRALAKVPPGPVIGVVAIVAIWLMSASPTASTRVPDLEGLQVNPAISQAAAAGFFAEVVFRDGGGVPGTVIRQTPAEHTIHDKRTAIVLEVTEGAAQITVPDVRGMRVEEARRELDRYNLEPGTVVYRDGGEVGSNRVITTTPRPGASVDVGANVDIVAAV